ncbi:unnamed protein product [Orchesella dallaii]|uniref:Uncharacterized protein n=1 Tax=Orchesella dallaii TaxID=48710 RepID=A0ABP1PV22_9HEXA
MEPTENYKLVLRSIILPLLIKFWSTQKSELLKKAIRLTREARETLHWACQHVLKPINSVPEDSVMSYRTELTEVLDTFKKTYDKLNNFKGRIQQWKQSTEAENSTWNEQLCYPDLTIVATTMTSEEIIFLILKWAIRIQVFPEWKSTISGLQAEWDEGLKMEIQRDDQRCARIMKSILESNK